MSWFRRTFGVDLVETVLWAGATFIVAVMWVDYSHDRMAGFGTALLSIVGYGVRRHFLLKRSAAEGETSGAWRVADLEGRVAELETLHQRVAELEERLDFNERLLAQQHEAPRLEAPK